MNEELMTFEKKLPRKELDDLLDYIYENGTAAEGVDRLAMRLCKASRNAALDEAAQLADDFFQGNSMNEGEVIYCGNIAMEIRNVLKDKS